MGYYDDYLEHHGILGQKWGVRRFENKNGHLTAAGKVRYDGDKVSKKEQRAAYNKRYDEWSSKQDANDAEFRRVQELRKGLGKTGLTRTINAARNKSDAAKEYNKAYDEWSSKQDKLDKEWRSVKASKPGLSDKQKKMIIAGAAIAGTALAAYGGYKIHQVNQQNKATKQAIDNATKALNDFKAAQSSMNRPNPMKPTSSGSFQNAAPKIDRSTVEHTPIDRIQIDRATVNRVKVDRTPINIDSFNKAAQANDDLVNNLFKKNAKNLGL